MAALPAAGQSLPLFHPINPVSESRSPLYFQPYVPPGDGWHFAVGLDYASLIETGLRLRLQPDTFFIDTAYLVDAEMMRLNLSVSRNLGPRLFLTGEAWLGGSHRGFLDGFLDWYHGLLGLSIPERQARPHNEFAYRYQFPGGGEVRFPGGRFYLGDVRLGLGRRHSQRVQSLLTLTLPTNTESDGYGRGVPGVGLLNTMRLPLTSRLVYEGSLGLGYTPRHGALRPIQRETFFLGTSGVRWRTVGGLWSMGNVYLHSPYYHGALASGLDRWEVDLDFGWAVRLGRNRGPELRFGMTEDFWPAGPAVDNDFRIGLGW